MERRSLRISAQLPYADSGEIHARQGLQADKHRLRAVPKISFDYEVVEKAKSVGVLPYSGEWRDLGTWNTLTKKLPSPTEGESRLHNCENTHIINELGIPVLGLGLKAIVIAVSPDGILISKKSDQRN